MKYCIIFLLLIGTACNQPKEASPLVLQTDFGTRDGAVSAMKGVAVGVDPDLKIYDLTHDIPVFNTWEAACRLQQAAPYWPAGTVFVSVVDPGVGTGRKSIVLRTKKGQYFVSPDNGSLTLIAEQEGIDAIREIDESINRRKGSETSYTFHGRDVYAYTGARLASGKMPFETIGKLFPADSLLQIAYLHPGTNKDTLYGMIPVLDIQFGNVWTNIPSSLLKKIGFETGDSLKIAIYNKETLISQGTYLFANTFGEVPKGQALLYLNSLLNLSIALNEGNFALKYGIQSGPAWRISITKTSN